MTDWKIGDKVYYFWHESDCSLIWNLKDLVIREDVVNKINKAGSPEFDHGYAFLPDEAFFKSKDDAKDAMIRHLYDLTLGIT